MWVFWICQFFLFGWFWRLPKIVCIGSYIFCCFFYCQSTVEKQQQQQQAIDELQNTYVSARHYKTVTGDKMTDIGNVYFIVKTMMFFTAVQLWFVFCSINILWTSAMSTWSLNAFSNFVVVKCHLSLVHIGKMCEISPQNSKSYKMTKTSCSYFSVVLCTKGGNLLWRLGDGSGGLLVIIFLSYDKTFSCTVSLQWERHFTYSTDRSVVWQQNLQCDL